MLAGVRLGEQNKGIVQRISLKNIVFKTREVKPFIVCTFGYGSRRATGEGKKENSKKPKLLKKANGERKAVISLS